MDTCILSLGQFIGDWRIRGLAGQDAASQHIVNFSPHCIEVWWQIIACKLLLVQSLTPVLYMCIGTFESTTSRHGFLSYCISNIFWQVQGPGTFQVESSKEPTHVTQLEEILEGLETDPRDEQIAEKSVSRRNSRNTRLREQPGW